MIKYKQYSNQIGTVHRVGVIGKRHRASISKEESNQILTYGLIISFNIIISFPVGQDVLFIHVFSRYSCHGCLLCRCLVPPYMHPHYLAIFFYVFQPSTFKTDLHTFFSSSPHNFSSPHVHSISAY